MGKINELDTFRPWVATSHWVLVGVVARWQLSFSLLSAPESVFTFLWWIFWMKYSNQAENAAQTHSENKWRMIFDALRRRLVFFFEREKKIRLLSGVSHNFFRTIHFYPSKNKRDHNYEKLEKIGKMRIYATWIESKKRSGTWLTV